MRQICSNSWIRYFTGYIFVLLLLISLTSYTQNCTGPFNGFVCGPNGTVGAAGTVSDPMDLRSCLDGSEGVPSSGKVYLLPGVYDDPLPGSTGQNIYRAYDVNLPGVDILPACGRYTARVFGGFGISSSNTRVFDIYFFNSDTVPGGEPTAAGSPYPIPTPLGFEDWGACGVAIQGGTDSVVVANTVSVGGAGAYSSFSATNATVYGNIAYDFGWRGVDRDHGHGGYMRAFGGTPLIIKHNLFSITDAGRTNGGHLALQIFGTTVGIDNTKVIANAFKGGCILRSEIEAATGIVWNENVQAGVRLPNGNGTLLGKVTLTDDDLDFHNNTMVNAFQQVNVNDWTSVTNGNTTRLFKTDPTWTRTAVPAGEEGVFADVSGGGGTDEYRLWLNDYDAQRANLVIMDLDLDDSVDIDPSTLLSPGQAYEVFHYRDIIGAPIVSGTWNSGMLTVPLVEMINDRMDMYILVASSCTSASGDDQQTACASYTWIDGNTYTTSNNTATHTLIGASSTGCDSIVTLDLTIINAASSMDNHTSCSAFTWIDGNTYTSNNNTATHIIVGGAANGCDSIITLNLVITGSSSQNCTGPFDGFVCGPNGMVGASGTVSDPMDLRSCLDGSEGIPSSGKVYLLPGTYDDPLPGSTGQHIYRAYDVNLPGVDILPACGRYTARVFGGFGISSSNTRVFDIYFFNSDTVPGGEPTAAGSPYPIPTPLGFEDWGACGVAIQGGTDSVVVANTVSVGGAGAYSSFSATNATVYGNIAYDFGWRGVDRDHGHGGYMRAYGGTPLLVKHNLFSITDAGRTNGGHLALQIFGTTVGIDNTKVIANAFKGGCILRSEIDAATGIVWNENVQAGVRLPNGNGTLLGKVTLTDDDLDFHNNTMVNAFQQVNVNDWTSVTNGNTTRLFKTDPTWTRTAVPAGEEGVFTDVSGGGGTDEYRLWLNDYDAQRANLVIMDLDLDDSVDIDPSTLLSPGQSYEVFHYRDIIGAPIVSGTWNSGMLRVPLVEMINDRMDMYILVSSNTMITGTDSRIECDSLAWIDGNTYDSTNTSAVYTIVGGASNGCDSTVMLDLTILQNSMGTDVQTECNSFTWLDGNTYTSSNNSATHTIVGGASNGCDSTVMLDLTILQNSMGTDEQTECNSYTWLDGNTYTSSNNSATHTIVGGASNGCDSIVMLDLTILQNSIGTDAQMICNSYTWLDGNTYTSSINNATHTIVGGSVNGCDSVVTLNLTITNGGSGIDTQVACESYTWIDGNTYTSSNNQETFTVTGGSSNGCDSIVTLNLTINSGNSMVTDSYNVCDSLTWIDGNTYTTSNNTATYTFVGGASNTCDSVVLLDLLVNNIDTSISILGDTLLSDQSGAVYQWLDCLNNFAIITNETNQQMHAITNGSYAVEIHWNGCLDTSSCFNVTLIGNEEYKKDDWIKVFPNPFDQQLNVLFTEKKNATIQLYDVGGREVKSYNLQKRINQLDLSLLKRGLYFLKIEGRIIRVIKR